ncbi:hypothetical protein FA13DRAFT_1624868, partial [Coprinellus micaceus]
DLLWVQLYTTTPDTGRSDAWALKWLDQLELVPMSKSSSWSFLDLLDVLWGAHITPRFLRGLRYNVQD